MEWQARSPDLNPIEHLWDYLGREVAALNPPPRSLHELKQGLLCVWSSLPIPVSDNLINSMGNRCRQCIQGCPPSKRDFHSASVIDNCMYIFGGRGLVEESDVECYPNKIMYLDTNSMMWSVPCTDAQAPCGRRSHTAVVYKGEIYIIGGFDGTKLRHLNDTFRYNPVSQEWTEMKVQGKPPFPSPKNDNDNDHGVFFSEVFIYPREHSDLYVLDFFPTLKRLATLKVVENNMDTNGLPSELQ
ncbi:kelch domain-containing protein 3 [Trichonephila clavipes]|nr:kelch domain-containing protein 3 [Trichonephila clavipes]